MKKYRKGLHLVTRGIVTHNRFSDYSLMARVKMALSLIFKKEFELVDNIRDAYHHKESIIFIERV